MNFLPILTVLVVALGGSLWFMASKNSVLEALLSNLGIKKKVNDLDGKVSKDQGLLDAQATERQNTLDNLKKEEEKDVTPKDVTDFYNNRK